MAALVMVAIITKDGIEALRDETCVDCHSVTIRNVLPSLPILLLTVTGASNIVKFNDDQVVNIIFPSFRTR